MAYKSVTVDVDVDVYLEDFDDEELIEELEDRDYVIAKKDESFSYKHINSLVMNVYMARVLDAPNLDEHLNKLFNEVLNRSI